VPADTAARDRPSAETRLQKVPAMKVDVLFQDKAEARESGRKDALPRAAKRREQTNLPEPVNTPRQQADASLAAATGDVRITTFESEVDPFEFSLLDSGHFVLFRKVWRDEQRYIQGMLIDAGTFLQQSIDANYDGSLAARAANLLIAYNDGILYPRDAAGAASYATAEFDGTLLYRDRLSVPLDPLELVFAVNKLPPGPGATVLAWVSLLLAAVFVAGFFALYRLGEGQIALARQQQDFVAAVSHELKTPLTSIRMYGEMLKEGWASEDRKQTYYDFIHDESERLTRLISNILQLARITRNEPQFDRKPVTVDELMSQLESKIATQAKRASVTVSYDCDEQCAGVSLDMDADCFAQIMINLVDNAIKFSRDAAKRQIDIACRRSSDGAVEFSVRDYGPGIARDQMQKIFELFYRSESELTRETAGTGIGLAIVMQLAAAMGGSVDLLNRDPGAEFSVSFPAA
jgi:signal transduction histidine kinase